MRAPSAFQIASYSAAPAAKAGWVGVKAIRGDAPPRRAAARIAKRGRATVVTSAQPDRIVPAMQSGAPRPLVRSGAHTGSCPAVAPAKQSKSLNPLILIVFIRYRF